MAIQLSRFDHHKVLGVSPSASPAQIDDAYQTLTAQLRDQPWQFERMRAIDRAYRALSRGNAAPVGAALPLASREPFIANGASEHVGNEDALDGAMADDTHVAAPRAAEDRFTEDRFVADDHREDQYAGDTYAQAPPQSDYQREDHSYGSAATGPAYEAEREDEVYTDDEDRPSRKPFYVVGAIGLAAVLGTLLFPATQRSGNTPGQDTAGSVVSSDPQVASTAGSPTPGLPELTDDPAANLSAVSELPVDAGALPDATGDSPVPATDGSAAAGISPVEVAEQREEESGPGNNSEDPAEDNQGGETEIASASPPPPAPVAAPPPRVEARPRPQAAGPSRAARAQWVRGGLVDSDNRGGQFEGAVGVRISVSPSGRPSDCRVARSSGNATLDSATCRLLVERLEFTPARDAAGNPVATEVNSTHVWSRRGRRR